MEDLDRLCIVELGAEFSRDTAEGSENKDEQETEVWHGYLIKISLFREQK